MLLNNQKKKKKEKSMLCVDYKCNKGENLNTTACDELCPVNAAVNTHCYSEDMTKCLL